ncbi:MAG: hypothetical protein IKH32_04105 [Prevotella sp.]|nr:hypothetical protein [Prevotella sp.]
MDFKKNIKELFSLRQGESATTTDAAQTLLSENRKEGETYKEYGFRMAGRTEGGLHAFTPCLQSVYLGLKKEQEEDEKLQGELMLNLQNKKANAEKEKEQEENNLRASKDRYKSLENEIDDKKQQLSNLESDSYRRNREAWITLIISGIILVPFTLYFFIFYSSVAYSAFFKEFTLESLAADGDFKLADAIFDSHALANAYSDGVTTLLFILLMPIIFLAFGFILNRWEKEAGWLKWVKIPSIIVVAFIFDSLLSYEICEKIYNLHTQMSLAEMPDYSLSLASHDPRFWVIICLGFVSYLIWGITFGYFVKALDQLDLNQIQREKINSDIVLLKERAEETRKEQNTIENRIANLKADIQKTDNQINGTVARYDVVKIKLELNNFHAGWQQYLAAMNKLLEDKNIITKEFENTLNTLITI